MATFHAANLEDLRTKATDAHATLVENLRQYKMLEEDLKRTWNGTAKDAFVGFMERYYQHAARLNDHLADTVDNIMKTNNGLQSQQADFQHQIASQTSTLDLPPLH